MGMGMWGMESVIVITEKNTIHIPICHWENAVYNIRFCFTEKFHRPHSFLYFFLFLHFICWHIPRDAFDAQPSHVLFMFYAVLCCVRVRLRKHKYEFGWINAYFQWKMSHSVECNPYRSIVQIFCLSAIPFDATCCTSHWTECSVRFVHWTH